MEGIKWDIHGIKAEKGQFNTSVTFTNESGTYKSMLRFDSSMYNSSIWTQVQDELCTLVYNHVQFPAADFKNETELNAFINSNYIKYSPNEKLANALQFLKGLMKFDGDRYSFIKADQEQLQIWRKYYYANNKELIFYIESLRAQGLIDFDQASGQFANIRFTVHGLASQFELEERRRSKQCFVAMSFDKEFDELYNNYIKPAVESTGFKAFRVDKTDIESDKTINDAIIAGIKDSHFTIADFTQQRHGVYFEAGLALGRGQKVIYTCRQDELAKCHFDTRNFQHIVWDTHEELKTKLIDKIRAFIIE